jgi:glycosyltransferase involved in cell wall biosynthesis
MSASARPRLLYLVHCYDNLAGVELHTRALAEGLADRFEVAVAYPHQDRLRLLRGGAAVEYPADPPVWPATPYRAPRTEQALAHILDAVRPDLIHVQHFLHWPLSVLDQAADRGVPVVVSFHDFYAITPRFTMQGTDDPEQTFTPAFARAAFGADLSAYLAERRRLLSAALARAAARVVVSPFLERQLARIFPGPYRVIEYGIPPFAPRPAPPHGPGLRFGCVGSLIPQKGWRSVLDAFPEVRRRHPDAQLHFHGGPVPPLPAPEGVTFHGPYLPADLPRLCAGLDVAVIPSVFAETHCLVLSEMWMAGLPVAVADIGALGERVADGVNGKKFRPGDRAAIAETLCWFLEHDDWRRWQLPRPRPVDAMLADYDSLYRELLAARPKPTDAGPRPQPDLLVVQVCDFLDDGDRFYRYHLPSRRLARLPGVRVIDCHYLHHLLPELLEAADVLVLQFIHDWGLLGMIERRRAAGLVTVFEANDDFFDLQPWNPIALQWQDRAVQEQFRQFLRAADAVQTSTEVLAQRWRTEARAVAVFANQLAGVPPLPPLPQRPLTIGWAGSPGHFADWYHVAPLLQTWLDAHPDVHLAVMTHDFARSFFRLPPERYHFTSFGSIADYYRFLPSLDIGLAPLLPSAYNRGRSDVKYLEYAACGVVGVYADLEPYRDSVHDGATGLLYRSGPELLACLDRLAADAGLRQRLRQQAHARVSAQRLADQHIGRRLDFYRGLLTRPPRGGPLTAEVTAAAVCEGEYWQLRPGQAEQTLLATVQEPPTPAAAVTLARLVERQPTYLAALRHLGRLHNDLKEPGAALPYLERARARQPEDARTLCEIGRALFLLNDAAGARAVLEEGLARQPLYYPGWQYLLRLLALHPSESGPARAERARDLFPACYPLALAGVPLHPPAAAVALLHRLLDQHAPTFSEEKPAAALAFGQAIAATLRAAGGTAETLALLRRACAVFPESARLASWLGQALYQAGQVLGVARAPGPGPGAAPGGAALARRVPHRGRTPAVRAVRRAHPPLDRNLCRRLTPAVQRRRSESEQIPQFPQFSVDGRLHRR